MAMKFVMNDETKEIVLVYPDNRQRTSDSLEAIMGYEILTRFTNIEQRLTKLEQIAAAMSGITKKEPDAPDKE
jgi:hypothetical protein